MSLSFSNTTTKNGIIQQIERNCGYNDGDITGNTTLMAQFTGDVNSALDEVLSIIFEVGGTWQFDDANHSSSLGYPFIQTDIVSGQRVYSFTADADSNLSLEIYKVQVADSTGLYRDILPVDVQSDAPVSFTDGLNTGGIPNTYDKTGKYVVLEPIPNYNYTNGLRVLINREGSYFTVNDTSKKPGFAGIFHEYLALRPSYMYCVRNQIGSINAMSSRYKTMMDEMADKIRDYYKLREKDVVKTLTGASTCSY